MGTAADIQLLNGTKLFYQVICYCDGGLLVLVIWSE